MTVTKINLCSRVSKRLENGKLYTVRSTSGDLKPVFDAFLEEILNALSEGGRIEIRGFGVFSIKNRKNRIGRNPRTGEKVDIPSYVAPIFKFSKDAQKIFDDKLKSASRITA